MARTHSALGSVDIVAAGIALKQCPITGGRPTRMSQKSFEAHCARNRKKDSVHYFQGRKELARTENYSSWCSVCKGKKPDELTIISRAEVVRMGQTIAAPKKAARPAINTTGGENMGSKKVKGICEGGCGDSLMLGNNYGVMMCTTCGNVHSNVRNRGETVVAAIYRTGMLEWYLGQLVGENQTVAVALENDFLRQVASEVGYEGTDPSELLAALKAKNSLIESYSQKQRTHLASDLELQHIADSVAWPEKDAGSLPDWISKKLLAGNMAQEQVAQVENLLGIEQGSDSFFTAISLLTKTLGQYRTRCEELAAKERETARLAAYNEQVLVAVRDAMGSPLIPLAETAYLVELLQQEVEQLRDGAAAPTAKPSALDSHLLDLLIDYPAISLERIATIREAA